jgi:hypothetical protein
MAASPTSDAVLQLPVNPFLPELMSYWSWTINREGTENADNHICCLIRQYLCQAPPPHAWTNQAKTAMSMTLKR